jgi:hypothetical protein
MYSMQLCRLCGERVRVPCIMVLPSRMRRKGKLAPVPGWPELEPIELPPNAFKTHNLDLVERGRVALPAATFVPIMGER